MSGRPDGPHGIVGHWQRMRSGSPAGIGERRGRRRGEYRRGARRPSTRQPKGVSIGVNLAPMIDMTFLLLIFFLVTTTFERVEGILASDLPPVSSSGGVPLPISPIVVRLTAGEPGARSTIAVDHFDPPPKSFGELVDLLRRIQERPGFDEQTPVVVVAGPSVPWEDVVDCWNAALRAGCERVAFGKP